MAKEKITVYRYTCERCNHEWIPRDTKNESRVCPRCKIRFVVVYGKIPAAILLPGEGAIGSDYDDDVCFWFGTNKLYLKRHILRAFEEAKRNLIPLFPAEFQRIS